MYIRRKVYSYSEPEEQLYSVTMTEEEYNLFSDFMDYVDYLEQRNYSAEAHDALKKLLEKNGKDSMTKQEQLQFVKEFDAGKHGGKDISGRINDVRKEVKNGNYKTTYIERGQIAPKMTAEQKRQARKDVKQAAKDTANYRSSGYHPTNNSAGKSAKKAAQVFEQNPNKYLGVIKKADRARWIKGHKGALIGAGLGTAALGAGAAYALNQRN